jgi:hypothetical protein
MKGMTLLVLDTVNTNTLGGDMLLGVCVVLLIVVLDVGRRAAAVFTVLHDILEQAKPKDTGKHNNKRARCAKCTQRGTRSDIGCCTKP